MTNRLSKWTRHSQKMVCLLAACGFLYGCKDEYLLDDEKPSTLSTSILESLQNPKAQGMGTFNTYLRLIADKDVNTGDRSLTDVLSRTGSKTVFVANDDAWSAFFKKNATLPESNPWHYATSYENLSVAQKKLLIHTSMLNNAIVMENLANPQFGVFDLADQMSVSRSTLFRKVKANTGQNVNEYIKICRLKKATELLASNRYMIKEISYMVGFSSSSYFAKEFKNQFGISPSSICADSET